MQSSHASILEYLYQFTIAKKTQERLSEIAYTSFVTIISTLITIGVTYGLNSLTSTTAGAAIGAATGTLSKITSSSSYHILKIGMAVATKRMKEFEELAEQ